MLELRIDAGPTPERATQVRLQEWEGPLGLLLSLIEARRVEILDVPLGTLAEAYLDALVTIDVDRMGHISSFVAVAAQLILIKSRAMLPRPLAAAGEMPPDEGPDPERELRERLLIYRAYRDAGLRLQADAIARSGIFRREPSAASASALAGAQPATGPSLDPAILPAALAGLVELLPPVELPSEVMPRTITLSERAAIIRAALRSAPTIVLQELLAGVRDRVVIAVTFLAMLELVKRRELVIDQAEPFGPIVARRMSREERRSAGLPADIDESALDESMASFA